jgi:uncharacterized protein
VYAASAGRLERVLITQLDLRVSSQLLGQLFQDLLPNAMQDREVDALARMREVPNGHLVGTRFEVNFRDDSNAHGLLPTSSNAHTDARAIATRGPNEESKTLKTGQIDNRKYIRLTPYGVARASYAVDLASGQNDMQEGERDCLKLTTQGTCEADLASASGLIGPATIQQLRCYLESVDLETLSTIVRKQVEAKSQDVVTVYLFGSFARGTANASSDVDLAILYSRSPEGTLESQPFRLEAELEKLIRRPIQIVVLNTAPVDLIHRVMRDGRIIVENDRRARVSFEVRARNAYFDLLPHLRRYRRLEKTR